MALCVASNGVFAEDIEESLAGKTNNASTVAVTNQDTTSNQPTLDASNEDAKNNAVTVDDVLAELANRLAENNAQLGS